jgi:hypothetical protein
MDTASTASPTAEREHLTLKWGVPKSWNLLHDTTCALLQKYVDLGWSMSAMSQPNTDAHRLVLCELIDAIDADTIWNDWSGEEMSKEAAKKYVMEYRK